MFNVGDRVLYTGASNMYKSGWTGRTGIVVRANDGLLKAGKVEVRWDEPQSAWPEDAHAWPFIANLELVEDEPVTEPDRDWIVLLMNPGGRKPVPFGPYTLDELFNVLEKGLIQTQDDEYLVKTQLRTDVR